jgi:hypothetical protein
MAWIVVTASILTMYRQEFLLRKEPYIFSEPGLSQALRASRGIIAG